MVGAAASLRLPIRELGPETSGLSTPAFISGQPTLLLEEVAAANTPVPGLIAARFTRRGVEQPGSSRGS
jgi:hypothetical protein